MQLILLSSTGNKEKSLYPYDMKYVINQKFLNSIFRNYYLYYLHVYFFCLPNPFYSDTYISRTPELFSIGFCFFRDLIICFLHHRKISMNWHVHNITRDQQFLKISPPQKITKYLLNQRQTFMLYIFHIKKTPGL